VSKRFLLDTCVLIAHWQRRSRGRLSEASAHDVRNWANELIALHKSNAIATPVAIEFLAGFTSKHDMDLGRLFAAQFVAIDGGDISKEEWMRARQIAERVPHSKRRRQLGDCSIAAIAERRRYDVFTDDSAFPKH
jgi:predicted nucleic acid-binding protein